VSEFQLQPRPTPSLSSATPFVISRPQPQGETLNLKGKAAQAISPYNTFADSAHPVSLILSTTPTPPLDWSQSPPDQRQSIDEIDIRNTPSAIPVVISPRQKQPSRVEDVVKQDESVCPTFGSDPLADPSLRRHLLSLPKSELLREAETLGVRMSRQNRQSYAENLLEKESKIAKLQQMQKDREEIKVSYSYSRN
jgi:hypothetical protein